MWTIGEKLRERREAAGLDQGQVVEYEGISKSYISQLETGRSTPNWDLLARLAYRYRTSADYILGLTDDPRPANGKALPPGGEQVLGWLAAMSHRGRDIFMKAAEAYYKSDQEWQRYSMVMDALAALPGGYDILEDLGAEESTRLRGITLDGVRLVVDTTERVIRIVPTNGNSQSSASAN